MVVGSDPVRRPGQADRILIKMHRLRSPRESPVYAARKPRALRLLRFTRSSFETEEYFCNVILMPLGKP